MLPKNHKWKSFLSLFFRPDWEGEVLEEVYQKYNTGLLILAYMAILGQTYFAIIEYELQSYYTSTIRVVNIVFCIFYIYYFKRINTQSKIDWHLFVITNFYWCEVEVEIYSFDSPFYDPSTWLMIPLLMMYHAFYFKNTPQKFFLYWFILIIYYYIRVSLSPVANFTSPELFSVLKYFLPSFLVASIFNFLWMQNRYTNQLYLRDLEREITKRIEIEKELAVRKAREAMVDDIHDHLGSAILDMKFKILEIMNLIPRSSNNSYRIQNSLFQIDDALRLNINSLSDFHYIREDFLSGIRSILFRRYEIFRRQTEVKFHEEYNISKFFNFNGNQSVNELYHYCMEICTNDLKYGYGTSGWEFYYDGYLNLIFNSQMEENNHFLKNSFNSIEKSILESDGFCNFQQNNELYNFKIRLPINKS